MKIKNFFSENIQKRICKPYLLAEAGVNHEGSLDLAKKLIEQAKEGGADGIKFQTYKAELLASKNSPSYWDLSKEPVNSQFKLFKKYDKFWKNEFEILKKHCDLLDIDFLSTPFDFESAKFLNDLMDVFKVSSSDLTNTPFVEYMCTFNKPIILSTGASNIDEIQNITEIILKNKNKLCLLHCVLNYPTEDHNANLGMIVDLKNKFPECFIGYSDHTMPDDLKVLEISTLLGASFIEKHFTLDKNLKGNDHYHAADKTDLINFNLKLDSLFKIIGSFEKKSLDSEIISRKNARRSLFLKNSIKKGDLIKVENIIAKRPATGISPQHINQVIGKRSKRNIESDETFNFIDLE
ncbi:N-acetylneuraminate synthase family protein [Alphaproteobacteria bacterium]|jgi:sialic acid synthase SpsE|nr:N-acetylneuraminate synthase family protein [Alphaproteobacteria bacterium]MDC3270696.1 N-acetylneuraminate synthase family protein [Alphaproteobacteria bacterium]